ncbi:MAG: COX15/CtaA family protein [Bacteroidia bacterium]
MNNKARRIIIYWLLTGCLLIFLMVIIGGITRLTGSGLSITEWKVVTGTLPPLNETQWQQEFYKYQQSPQYKLINSNFTVEDFKGIYWWEYLHRLIGRFISLVFLIPFLYFLRKKWVDKILLPKLITIFSLGALLGTIGWLMVFTGLQDKPYVSHFALAAHLICAFTTFAYIFWVALDLMFENGRKKLEIGNEFKIQNSKFKIQNFSITLLVVLFIQIIYGAFVAGLKAGHVYNTWPKMGDEWIAESVTYAYAKDGISSLFYNLASVQFIHRTTAIILFLMVCYLWMKRKNSAWNLSWQQINALNIGLAVVMMQFLLGVFTLLYNVPTWLGVLHQAGAFVLLGSVVYLLHRLRPVY